MTTDHAEALTWHPERPRFKATRLLLSWLLTAAALWFAAAILPGVDVDTPGGALLMALAIAALNAVLPTSPRRPTASLHGRARLRPRPGAQRGRPQSRKRSRRRHLRRRQLRLGPARGAGRRSGQRGARSHLRYERRRHVHAQGHPADRAQAGRRGANRPAWNHLPRDRRAGSPGAAQSHARRERADDGTLARREVSSPCGMGNRPLVADGCEPGRDPARLERQHLRASGGSRRRPGRS